MRFQPKSQRSVAWGIQRRTTLWDKRFQSDTGSKTDSEGSTIDLATTRLRVSRLKVAGRLLRDVSQKPIPTELSKRETQMEEQYSEWLGRSSDRLEELAVEGTSIVEAMRNGSTARRVGSRSNNLQKVQRLLAGSEDQSWDQAYPSSSSIGGTGALGTGSSLGELEMSSSNSVDNMMIATREMQEMNQSFNLQYLQLQQKMQQENRQFTMMSNIMKTKHDTAKNAINNIR
jgi:hypothetical protein